MITLSSTFLSLVLLLSVSVQLCSAQSDVNSNSAFQIGVILDSDSLVGRIGLTSLSLALSDFYSLNNNYTTNIDAAADAFNPALYSPTSYFVRITLSDAVMTALSDGTSAGSYDELASQVYLQKYDATVGDITITSKRSEYVDFTLPFSGGGVDIVVPITYNHQNNNWIFLKPLTKELWLTAIALFIFTCVAIWILEHRFNDAYSGPLPNKIKSLKNSKLCARRQKGRR